MKIIKNEEINIQNKINYVNFYEHQTIVNLNLGDTVEIFVNGIKITAYISQFTNSHFNLIIQDMDEELTLAEREQNKLIVQTEMEKIIQGLKK
jgi:hypothetical protein